MRKAKWMIGKNRLIDIAARASERLIVKAMDSAIAGGDPVQLETEPHEWALAVMNVGNGINPAHLMAPAICRIQRRACAAYRGKGVDSASKTVQMTRRPSRRHVIDVQGRSVRPSLERRQMSDYLSWYRTGAGRPTRRPGSRGCARHIAVTTQGSRAHADGS